MKKAALPFICALVAGHIAFAVGVAIDFSDIQGMPDDNAIASFEKGLKDLDPLRQTIVAKMSDRKPTFVKQDERTVTIRYFFTLSYAQDKYCNEYLPKVEKILQGVAKGASKELKLKLSRGDLTVRTVELTQEPTMFKPGILDYTRGNPEIQASAFYVPDQASFISACPCICKPRQLVFNYIDVVDKVSKSGMMAVRRYEVSGEIDAAFAKWCHSYFDGLKNRKVLLSLLDADGEPLEEKLVAIRYPGIFNYPQDQPYVGFHALAPRNDIAMLANNPETGYANYYIVFSPMFIAPLKNSLQAGGLVETLECFVDVTQKKTELKSVAKAEIKFVD